MKWLLRDKYDTVAWLENVDRPVVVAIAERDTIVPARRGAALHAALLGSRHLVMIEGAGHNDWPDRVDAACWRRVSDLAAAEAD